jgi:hypothetical protein
VKSMIYSCKTPLCGRNEHNQLIKITVWNPKGVLQEYILR